MLNDDLDDTVNVYTEVIQVETYAIHNKLTYLPIAFMYSSKFSDAEIFHFPIILAIFPSYILWRFDTKSFEQMSKLSVRKLNTDVLFLKRCQAVPW